MDRRSVEALLDAVHPGEWDDIRPLTPGLERQVTAFHDRASGGDLVLRTGGDLQAFAREAMIEQRFGHQVPMPPMIGFGEHAPYGAWCITGFIAGQTVQDVPLPALDRLREPIHATLAAIHGCDPGPGSGFGPIDGEGNGPFQHWADVLAVALDPPCPLVPGVAPGLARQSRLLLDALLPSIGDHRALVHADYGSNNLLTDGSTITSVLDWESAIWGDPLYDVANIMFWAEWEPCMTVQAAYELHRLGEHPDDDACQRILAGVLAIALREAFHPNPGKAPYRSWLGGRISQIVDCASAGDLAGIASG